MTIMYRVGSERLNEADYRQKYPRLYREMRRKQVMMRKMNFPPLSRAGVDCARSADRHDFRHERDPDTGLDGRYMPQLARYPNDPTAVVKHVDDVIEVAKRRHLKVDRTA